MYKLVSYDKVYIAGRGMSYIVSSPVAAVRSHNTMLEAIGRRVDIDGVVYKVKGFEMYCLGGPVRIGERIGILVGTTESS